MDINIILAGYLEPGLLADKCWESVKTPLLLPPPILQCLLSFLQPGRRVKTDTDNSDSLGTLVVVLVVVMNPDTNLYFCRNCDCNLLI